MGRIMLEETKPLAKNEKGTLKKKKIPYHIMYGTLRCRPTSKIGVMTTHTHTHAHLTCRLRVERARKLLLLLCRASRLYIFFFFEDMYVLVFTHLYSSTKVPTHK